MSEPAAARRTSLVWSLYLLLGLFSFVACMIGPAVPYLRDEFHLGYTLAGMHIAMFAAGMMTSGVCSAAVLHRVGLMGGLWGGMAGTLAGAVLLVLARTVWLTLPAILVMGAFSTLCMTATVVTLASLFPGGRGKALLEANVISSIFSALPPFVIVLGSLTFLGWRLLTPFFALCLAGVALFGWSATRHHGTTEAANAPDAPGPLPLGFWVLWVQLFFCVAVEWCLGFWTAEYLKGLPGHSLRVAAAGAGVFQVAAIAGRWSFGKLAGKISEPRLLAGAMLLVAAGFPLYWLRAGTVSAFAGVALGGLGAATFYPLVLAQAITASGGRERRGSSRATIASGMGVGFAPMCLGRLADAVGLPTAQFVVPLGLGVMALLMVVRRLMASPAEAPGAVRGS